MKDITNKQEENKIKVKKADFRVGINGSTIYASNSSPSKESYEKYREPDDPQSAEFVRVKTRKSTAFWRWYTLIGVFIPIISMFLGLMYSEDRAKFIFFNNLLILSVGGYFFVRNIIKVKITTFRGFLLM